MSDPISALYHAIERNEDHAATISALLSVLSAQYELARGDKHERERLDREIAYYVARRAALHAERDQLRCEVNKLRKGEKQ